MIKSALVLVCVALAATSVALPANAHKKSAKAHATGKIHFGGQPGLGYWRKGPKTGFGFGFSTYRDDPFGADDYYDGDRCYYLHKRDFCVSNKIFTGFRSGA